MKPYPIFLNTLVGRRCVVVGGDHEAERKALDLLDYDADDVVVIAPDVTGPLAEAAEAGRLTWLQRNYAPGDLAGAFLAIVSETNPRRTAPIWDEAERERVLLNAMDDIPHCTFVAGSVVRRGPLVVSISSSGYAPTLAVRLRQSLEQRLGPEVGVGLRLLQAIRPAMATTYPNFDERRARWYAAVDSAFLDHVRAGDPGAAVAALAGVVGPRVAAVLWDDALDVPGWSPLGPFPVGEVSPVWCACAGPSAPRDPLGAAGEGPA